MQRYRAMAGVLAGLMMTGVTAGCGGQAVQGESRNRPAPYSAPAREQPRQGMSTRNKVLMLAGAAALYYMWKKSQSRPESATGPEGRYYRSRNGRIYYRDAQGQAHWVSPPQQPIQVPADEYQRYFGRSPEGYDGGVIRNAPQGAF